MANKLDAVRQLLEENPDIGAKDGVPLMKERFGMDITESTFNNYKSTIKKGGGSPKKKRAATAATPELFAAPAAQPAASPAPRQVGTSVADVLEAAQKLIDDVGALEAQRIINLLARKGAGNG